MSDGEPPKSRPIRAVKQTSGLLPVNRDKPASSPELQSEADKRREEREIAKEQREEAKEKREERSTRLSRRVATFAVVVSLLGSGATATVAIMSMKATQASAQENIKSSAEQADKSFIRDQQRAAYADFYAVVIKLSVAEAKVVEMFSHPIDQPPVGGSPEVDELRKRMQLEFYKRYDELNKVASDMMPKYALINIYGGSETVAVASQMMSFLQDVERSHRLVKSFEGVLAGTADADAEYEAHRKAVDVMPTFLDAFLASARKDFDQPPLGQQPVELSKPLPR